MKNDTETIVIYKDGKKIATITRKFVSNTPHSLARGLNLEKDNGAKYYNLILNENKQLDKITIGASSNFAEENKREFRDTIQLFKNTYSKLEEMKLQFCTDEYQDDVFDKYVTRFSRFFLDDGNDEDKKHSIFNLIRRAYNAGFYVRDGHILIGAPSQCKRLEDLVELIFLHRRDNKNIFKGMHRYTFTYFLLRFASKFNSDIEELRNFWAFAFYQSYNPNKDKILDINKLQSKTSLPFFPI